MQLYLCLIRHGQTKGTINHEFYGWTDYPLVKEGIDEIKNLKNLGIYPNFKNAYYYTSGMVRAEETFKIIYDKKDSISLAKFKEINFGSWETKTFDEICLEKESQIWLNTSDGSFTYPKGESYNSFYNRIKEGLLELKTIHKNKSNQNIVLVCHGGTISVIMQIIFNKPYEDFLSLVPKPGHGYIIKLEDFKPIYYKEL